MIWETDISRGSERNLSEGLRQMRSGCDLCCSPFSVLLFIPKVHLNDVHSDELLAQSTHNDNFLPTPVPKPHVRLLQAMTIPYSRCLPALPVIEGYEDFVVDVRLPI